FQVELVGLDIAGADRRSGGCVGDTAADVLAQRRDDGAGDLVLDGEHVFCGQRGIEGVRPEMRVASGIDQLGRHPDRVTGLAYAPFEDVTNAELARNGRY